jgi:GlpG protein
MLLPDNMRLIGNLESEAKARKFGDYLAGLDIKNELEAETDGAWGIWVYSEEQLEISRQLLQKFRENPNDPQYASSEGKTAELLEREEKAQEDYEKKVVTGATLWNRGGFGIITTTFLSVSILAAFASKLNGDAHQLDVLRLSNSLTGILPEIQRGEVWRLVTPIFIHFGFLHLLFNMMMLIDLGSRIENREHPVVYVGMILLIAGLSNLGQFFFGGGWNFGGMSGVIYGLFGFIWIRGKSDPQSGYFIDSMLVIMMLVWFVLSFRMPHVANWCHAVGLALGMAWGALPWLKRGIRG